MKLSELISEIGDDKVEFQFVSPSLRGNQKQGKGFVSITIGTSAITLLDLVSDNPSKVGIIMWLPGDRFREIQNRISEQPK